jgi:hypothetical protein
MKECDNNKEHIPEISGKLLVEYLLPAAHRWLAKRGGVQEALHGIMVIRSKKHNTSDLSCPGSLWKNCDTTMLL